VDISFQERQENLHNRIRAHKLFANFDIEQWIAELLKRRQPKRVFDLGCGDGNHLGLYLRQVGPAGAVAGLDREPQLIEKARERYSGASNLDLRVGSMDDPLPFGDASFDLCLSIFAIYNARDVRGTLHELSRILVTGGAVVLVGPTPSNAQELHDYNQRLTGIAADPRTRRRTDRLREEVLPVVRDVFPSVETSVLDAKLTFPSREEFVRYYRSTLLYEDTARERGVPMEEMLAACPGDEVVLSKQMLAVVGELAADEAGHGSVL
jgi:ubiquinone/menaquinone biosynthesis C-methylase UbiE